MDAAMRLAALFGGLLALFGSGIGEAGEAAWNDAGTEFAVVTGEQGLAIGAGPGRTREVKLPAELAGRVLAVGATKADGWIALTSDALWRKSPAAAAFERWVEAGPDLAWQDLAVDPASGNVLLTGEVGRESGEKLHALRLYVRKLGRVQRVFSRRVGELDGPSFAPDGTLCFGARGDLWQGRLVAPEAASDEEGAWSLEAARWVPLAYLETANATPSSYGVRATAVTAAMAYVHLYRLGGSGFGWVVRLPRAKWSPDAAAEDGPLAHWRQTAEALRRVEMLGAQGRPAQLAAARDGKVGFLLDDGPKVVAPKK
ncbi:MAG: hypothetical protein JSR82_21670 [Verrucomicrobia bacterium]|nr:hypothetical protein [Verrucomicrobiota bacterium]